MKINSTQPAHSDRPSADQMANRSSLRWECILGLVGVSILAYVLRPLLFFQDSTLFHDNFYWNFPVFHFFAVNLMQGSLPLWDPYTSGGQPFYPLLVQFRLLEPIAIITVLFGSVITSDTATLFHWTRFLESLWMALGSYLVLRKVTPYALVRFILIPLFLFSSFFLASFRQDGVISQYLWAPWVLFFLNRIFVEKQNGWINWIALAFSIGINFQSYFFVGVSLLVLIFLVHSAVFDRSVFTQIARDRAKAFTAFGVVLAMMGPNLALLYDSGQFSFPLRMVPPDYKERLLEETGLLPAEASPGDVDLGIRMDYNALPYSGAFTKIWEWLQMVHPSGNKNIFMGVGLKPFGNPAEAYIYLGLSVFVLGLMGLFWGKDKRKTFWAVFIAGFGLLMLGPPGGLHRLLYPLFPPLWFLRHTDLLNLYFVFGFLYFFVLGMNVLIETGLPQLWMGKKAAILTLLFSVWVGVVYVAASRLEYPIFKFPETNLLFLAVLAVAASAYLIQRKSSPGVAFWGLVLGHFLAVGYLAPQKESLLLYWGFFLLVPMLGLRWMSLSAGAVVFIFCLFLDIAFSFDAAKVLYTGMPHPRKTVGSVIEPKTIGLEARSLQPLAPPYFQGHQSPRYLSLLQQKPFAMSGRIFPVINKAESLSVNAALQAPRWNTYLLLKNYHLGLASPKASRWVLEAFRLGKFPLAWYLAFPELGGESFELNGSVQWERFSSNDLRVSFTAPEKGFLYWSDGFDPWWRAEVDGKAVVTLRAMDNFKAIELTPGSHDIKFQYRPVFFLIGLCFFYGVPLAAMGIILFSSLAFGSLLRRDEPCPA